MALPLPRSGGDIAMMNLASGIAGFTSPVGADATGSEVIAALAMVALVAVYLARHPLRGSVSCQLDGDVVVIRLRGMDHWLCTRHEVRVPLDALVSIQVIPARAVEREGIRLAGTSVQGAYRGGVFGGPGFRDFWCVRNGDLYLVLEDGQRTSGFRKIVIETAEAGSIARALRAAAGT